MVIFARRVELPDVVTVQGLHDPDPGEHRRAAEFDHQHQRLATPPRPIPSLATP
jgi:hypothetical protein